MEYGATRPPTLQHYKISLWTKMAYLVLVGLLCLSLIQLISYQAVAWRPIINPTTGFSSFPLNQSNLIIQRPYDVPENERYSFDNGVHKLWVYSTDKPHSPTSKTNPRTEIRIHRYDYSSGVWQFEAKGYVPRGASGVCIMQVFGARGRGPEIQLQFFEDLDSLPTRLHIIGIVILCINSTFKEMRGSSMPRSLVDAFGSWRLEDTVTHSKFSRFNPHLDSYSSDLWS
ncbi:hypothetical protein Tsubulata_042973 [Turnera subulata]|uniref:Alginate lyase 2 domain-containing protein n=1 Tax=Turnera subulata TaxID=218843 RepID=A0A9Q0JBW5_9ROSI|nr:hypothetical protein Tsubulata_042973 [Turnera subulata]